VRHNSSQIALIALLAVLAFGSLAPSSRAEERWFGVITAADDDGNSYTVETDDGRVFYVIWEAGYSGWDLDDKVILTVDSGFGFMVYGTRHTYVWVEETVEAVPDDDHQVPFPEL
jgi:hypothetical protein